MKAYKTTIRIETEWIMEVHAESEKDAEQIAMGLSLDAIEAGGDAGELESITVTDVERIYSENDEDEVEVDEGKAWVKKVIEAEWEEAIEPVPTPEEVVPEPGNTVTEMEVESKGDDNDKPA